MGIWAMAHMPLSNVLRRIALLSALCLSRHSLCLLVKAYTLSATTAVHLCSHPKVQKHMANNLFFCKTPGVSSASWYALTSV